VPEGWGHHQLWPSAHRRAPAAEGRMRLRRVQSRGFETGHARRRAYPPALMRPSSRTMRRSPAGTSRSPMESEAKTVKVGGSSGGVPPLPRATARPRGAGFKARRAGGVPPPLVLRQGRRASVAAVMAGGESSPSARGYTAA
jgi:hypothetical protein